MVWGEREDLIKSKGTTSSAQEGTIATCPIPTQPGPSTSAQSHQAHPNFSCGHGGGGVDIDKNENLLPQAVTHLHEQPDAGMPTSSFCDKLIQRDETRFLFSLISLSTWPTHSPPRPRRTVRVSTVSEVRGPSPPAALRDREKQNFTRLARQGRSRKLLSNMS